MSLLPPINLCIDGENLRFERLSDLGFSLTFRTTVPIECVDDLTQMSHFALTTSARDVRVEDRRILRVLWESFLRGPENSRRSATAWLARCDLSVFSTDHQWRGVFRGLAAQPRIVEAYKQLALAKYLQFLLSKQSIIYSLLPFAAIPTAGHEPISAPSSLEETQPKLPKEEADRVGTGPGILLKRGEPLVLPMANGRTINIWLADYAFKILNAASLIVIDPDGQQKVLAQARGLVGREAGCSVQVNNRYLNISRVHLLLIRKENELTLVDLSTHGTFIEADDELGPVANASVC